MRILKSLYAAWFTGFIAIFCLLGSPVHAAGYSLIFDKSFHPGGSNSPTAHSLIKTSEGEYVLAGQSLFPQLFAIKTRPDGQPKWEVLIEGGLNQDAYAALDAGGKDVLLVGRTNSVDLVPGELALSNQNTSPHARGITDAPFATRLDGDGKVIWKKAYGTLARGSGRGKFTCGTWVGDGFVLIGSHAKVWTDQPIPNGTDITQTLWVIKVSEKGELVWETEIADDSYVNVLDRSDRMSAGEIPEDGPERIDTLYLTQRECSTPLMDAQGNIVFAISARGRPTIIRKGKTIVSGPEIVGQTDIVLTYKLDRNGRVVNKLRLQSGAVPRLFATKSGYILLDNFLGKERRLRKTFLNQKLEVTSQYEIRSAGFFMEAALLGKNDGIHMAGYFILPPNEHGKAAIAYLSPSKGVVGLQTFGSGSPSWNPIALAPGNSPDEIVLLRCGGSDTKNDVGVMKFSFSGD